MLGQSESSFVGPEAYPVCGGEAPLKEKKYKSINAKVGEEVKLYLKNEKRNHTKLQVFKSRQMKNIIKNPEKEVIFINC